MRCRSAIGGSLLIRGGVLVRDGAARRGDVRVRDGRISELGTDLAVEGDPVLEVDGGHGAAGGVLVRIHR